MRRALSFTALLLAWLCAQGAVMDAVQVFAWGRMFAGYAKTQPWTEAARQTFDPNKPCQICCALKKAREREEKTPAAPLPPDVPKLVLFFATAALVAAPTGRPMHFVSPQRAAAEWCAPVPTPPPRGAGLV